jgi:hypothetical protein
MKSTKSKQEWLRNWEAFVGRVAELHREGNTDVQISTSFDAQTFVWEGVIEKLAVEEKYAAGISLRMTSVKVPLKERDILVASFLAARVAAKHVPDWKRFVAGDRVRFEGIFRASDGVMPGVWISRSKVVKHRLTMTIGLFDARPLGRTPPVEKPERKRSRH